MWLCFFLSSGSTHQLQLVHLQADHLQADYPGHSARDTEQPEDSRAAELQFSIMLRAEPSATCHVSAVTTQYQGASCHTA